MSLGKIKTEMKGTGGGRWMKRVDAKKTSKKKRRIADKRTARDQKYESSADTRRS